MLSTHSIADLSSATETRIKLSEVIAALSYALDITEGQPKGHAARSCMLACKSPDFASVVKSSPSTGCCLKTSAARATPERCLPLRVRRSRGEAASEDGQLDEPARFDRLRRGNVATGGSWVNKFRHFARVAVGGQRDARRWSNWTATTAQRSPVNSNSPSSPPAPFALDEHWDGLGHPPGRYGETFRCSRTSASRKPSKSSSPSTAWRRCEMVAQRSGTWFDPQLVDIFLSLKGDTEFWNNFDSGDPATTAATFEPNEMLAAADDAHSSASPKDQPGDQREKPVDVPPLRRCRDGRGRHRTTLGYSREKSATSAEPRSCTTSASSASPT